MYGIFSIEEIYTLKLWEPLVSSINGPAISHCSFADDVILFSNCSSSSIKAICDVLEDFNLRSGLNINFQKSHMYFSASSSHSTKSRISDQLNIPAMEDLGKYLGFPIYHKHIFINTYGMVLDRVKTKLSSREANLLSFAGRKAIVHQVFFYLANFYTQCAPLPISLCNETYHIQKNLLWVLLWRRGKCIW